MFTLLESIGDFFTSIVNFIKTSVNFIVAFFESVLEIVNFAFSNSVASYLPAFVLPVFVLLVVYAVVKLIINRQ